MHSVVSFVENWNFIFPLILWALKEALVRLRARRGRVGLWRVRHDRPIAVVLSQQSKPGNYRTGELGPLAEARAAQKLLDHFRGIGLNPAPLDERQFDQSRSDNLVIAGVLTSANCLVASMLVRLGYPVSVSADRATVGSAELAIDLRLVDGHLSVATEYGIVVREQNPNDKRHSVVIIAALTARGLEDTVDVLLRKSRPAILYKRRGPKGVVVQTVTTTGASDVKPLAIMSTA